MPKDMTPIFENLFLAKHTVVVPMVDLLFSMESQSDPLYLNLSGHTFTWNGNTYLGAGQLLNITPIDEVEEVQTSTVSITMGSTNAMFKNKLAEALQVDYRNNPAIIYLGALDSNYLIVDDPIVIFSGRMENMDINLAGEGSITVNCISGLADWENPRGGRWTDTYQKRIDAADKGLEWVEELREKDIIWGSRKIRAGTTLEGAAEGYGYGG